MKKAENWRRNFIIILLIGAMVGSVYYFTRTPYGKTPEEAINAYLKSVTSHYTILTEKAGAIDNNSVRFAVTADCRYNWWNSNQGREDGGNTYFFDLDHTGRGWYVVAANSGP